MRNIRLTIAYDGTDFCGWQVQKNGRTVQETIEKALEKLHKHPVFLHGAGRTDSGVHATGQTASFISDAENIPPGKFNLALNSILPKDVRITGSGEVHPSFHARFSAVARTYHYYLYPSGVRHPVLRNYCWQVKRQFNLPLLNDYAARLVGQHDFTAFSGPRNEDKSPFRNIHAASFFPMNGFTVFSITGNAFLWKMVRSIIGTLLELEYKKAGPDRVREIIESGNRALAGSTAPATGLYLHKVSYT
ncbi:MAG: tRNA pseudouridine(38-40) synthase TruA [Spirochaetales bacterium]|nr:MAG: tRNA pseudouridine(38-40) synthase TruA [Spirochaetales bacterium]